MEVVRPINKRGFTIIELLVVVVVIGILTAISVISYNVVIKDGHDTAIKNDFSNLSKVFEVYKGRNNGYPATTDLTTLGIKVTKNSYDTTIASNILYCLNPSNSDYGLFAKSKSGKIFSFKASDEKVNEYTGTFPGTATTLCNSLGVGSGTSQWFYNGSAWASWVAS